MVISLKSTFKTPQNLIEQVKLDSKLAMILFILSQGFLTLSPVIQLPLDTSFSPPLPLAAISSTVSTILSKDWLSIGKEQSACFMIQQREKRLLYGEVTTSSLIQDGKTEAVNLKMLGNQSSRTPKMQLPSPEPVPPPKECKRKKDWSESQCSVSLLILSTSKDRYLVPYQQNP